MRHRCILACTAIALLLLATACVPLIPTPDDFPQPPWTPIVEFPTPAFRPTPTPAPLLKPIYPQDMLEARNLFLLVQVGITAGDSALLAEHMHFPLQVTLNGQSLTVTSAADFEKNYERMLTPALQQVILAGKEDELMLLPDGVKAAGGGLWFNQFCTDPACTRGQFLITHINN